MMYCKHTSWKIFSIHIVEKIKYTELSGLAQIDFERYCACAQNLKSLAHSCYLHQFLEKKGV